MKRGVLFFPISLILFFYTEGYSGNPSLFQISGSLQPISAKSSSGNNAPPLILANGMPSEGESQPRTKKDRSSEGTSTIDTESKEAVEPREAEQKEDEEGEELSEEIESIADPLESFNRAMFKFNDKLYFWVLKPTARGYRAVLPKKARTSVRRFFSNAATPVRLLNCTLQGKMKGAAIEPTRFFINTTVGVVGLFDPAESLFHLKVQEADFDQTLGLYGMNSVIYINWPILGPSSVRGTLGFIGDSCFDPSTFLLSPVIQVGIAAYEEVNETSLTIGEYEDIKASSLDPYIAIRDAYFQNRESKLKTR